MVKLKLFFLLFVSCASHLAAQDTIIFYLGEKDFFKSVDSFLPEFHDTLPDGVYIQYDVMRKDRNKKGKHILVIGQFKNKLKDGKFEINHYGYFKEKKEWRVNQQYICNYKYGVKDGLECNYYIWYGGLSRKVMIFQGEYLVGKRNGLFLYYEYGSLMKAEVYNNNTLVTTYNYPYSRAFATRV
ncbi:MAG: hypothetical protein K1X81_09860 [Bacteroidia bacterium]|nr:hypothetical protein [Bacteroidia bacterium]